MVVSNWIIKNSKLPSCCTLCFISKSSSLKGFKIVHLLSEVNTRDTASFYLGKKQRYIYLPQQVGKWKNTCKCKNVHERFVTVTKMALSPKLRQFKILDKSSAVGNILACTPLEDNKFTALLEMINNYFSRSCTPKWTITNNYNCDSWLSQIITVIVNY